jgi:IclR-like helix-turn-helix domain-containing protein
MYPKEILWVGAKGGLVCEKHRRRMGEAIWLFLWCLTRQTDLNQAGEGVVYYGRPIPLREIAEDTGLPIGTLHRWMNLLIEQDYIRVEIRGNEGTIFWVLNAKDKAKGKKQRSKSGTQSVPDVERKRSESGTLNGDNLSQNQSVTASPTKLASKSLYSNTDAATKAVAVISSLARQKQIPKPKSWEQQKAELRQRGLL